MNIKNKLLNNMSLFVFGSNALQLNNFTFNLSLTSIVFALAFISAIKVITTKNAVVSVLYLILLYLLAAIYLFILGITFVGLTYIIVYIGAIAILFLFIIMMIDI